MYTAICSTISVLFLLLAHVATAFAQDAMLEGSVRDGRTGVAIPGATVQIEGTMIGTTTDANGRYELVGLSGGSYAIIVSYLGFVTAREVITLVAGERRMLDVRLQERILEHDPIIVTAAGRPQQASDIPAPVEIMEARTLEADVTPSPVNALRMSTGVDVATTGVDNQEVVIRGFNNAFSGAAFVLVDHRQSAIPSLAVNSFNVMPISDLDLARVEIVRGPASVRYGPGVDRGVIHFITKDAFQYPGTSISVAGGQQSYFSGTLRHAGVVNGRFGYKVSGFYSQAEEWPLDLTDPHDMRQDSVYFGQIPRQDKTMRAFATATAEYRFAPGTSLMATGGWAGAESVFLSGIGTLQADGLGYTFGQLRFQAGDFVAQAFLNRNNSGNSFVYASGAEAFSGAKVVDNSTQLKVESQYGTRWMNDRQELIGGIDWQQTTPRTERTITGRFEDDDIIREVGVYVQSGTQLTGRLNLVLSARLDYDNIYETPQVSPRAGLVFKPSPSHAFHAAYNRAISDPSTNSEFLDVTASTTSLSDNHRLVVQAIGANQGFTFNNFRETNAAEFLFPVPGFFRQPVALGQIPLVPVYAAAAPGIAGFLMSPSPLPLPIQLTPQMRNDLAALLGYTASTAALGTATTDAVLLGIPDDSEEGYRIVGGPIDVRPLEQTISQSVEVGYKGAVHPRLVLAVDAYYAIKRNFVGPLAVESPFAYLQGPGLSQDVGAALASLWATTQDPTILQLLQTLSQQGLPPAQVTAILAGLVGGGLADSPVAIVQSDTPVHVNGRATDIGAFLTYRNFGRIDYFGVEAAFEYAATDEVRLSGNFSWISDDFFDHAELGEDNEDLFQALNAPPLKLGLGIEYYQVPGFTISLSGRYADSFPVNSGPYIGRVDSYFLLDAGLGYAFSGTLSGLRANLTVQNVLGNEHREFIGAPKIGRLAIARLTYTL